MQLYKAHCLIKGFSLPFTSYGLITSHTYLKAVIVMPRHLLWAEKFGHGTNSEKVMV